MTAATISGSEAVKRLRYIQEHSPEEYQRAVGDVYDESSKTNAPSTLLKKGNANKIKELYSLLSHLYDDEEYHDAVSETDGIDELVQKVVGSLGVASYKKQSGDEKKTASKVTSTTIAKPLKATPPPTMDLSEKTVDELNSILKGWYTVVGQEAFSKAVQKLKKKDVDTYTDVKKLNKDDKIKVMKALRCNLDL